MNYGGPFCAVCGHSRGWHVETLIRALYPAQDTLLLICHHPAHAPPAVCGFEAKCFPEVEALRLRLGLPRPPSPVEPSLPPDP